MPKAKYKIGDIYKNITILNIRRNERSDPTYTCQCKCGQIKEMSSFVFKNGHCGCLSKIRRPNMVIDKITLLELVHKDIETNKSIWLCECECGRKIELEGWRLNRRKNKIVSCGCENNHKKRDKSPIWTGYKEITGTYWSGLKSSAKARNLTFSITKEYVWGIFEKQQRKCVYTGELLKFESCSAKKTERTASLDRIDSSKGYIEGNVQWVSQDVNFLKHNRNEKEFIELCRKCYLNSIALSDRPGWDEYFLMLAFDISSRSDDQFIKHGAIIVDNLSKHIIGTGYNGTFSGADAKKVQIYNREARRPYMIHAEENAMLNCSKNPKELKDGASIYITGLPCVNCLQRIINFGITNIVYAERQGSITENSTNDIRKNILSMTNINIKTIPITNKWIKKVHYEPE